MPSKTKDPWKLSPESEKRRQWQIAARKDDDIFEQQFRYEKWRTNQKKAAAQDPNYVYKPYSYDDWGDSPETEKKLQELAKNAIEGAKRREAEWETEKQKASEKRGGSKKKTVKRRSRKYGKTKRRK